MLSVRVQGSGEAGGRQGGMEAGEGQGEENEKSGEIVEPSD